MGHHTRRSALALGTALGLCLGAPAFAQSASGAPGNANASTLGEVVVTARRMEERLQDVPISITVFNQQQLNDRNIVNGADLATYTPSLAVDTRFGTDNASFAIRGFTQELRTGQTVATYFADVVTPRTNSPFIDGAGPGAFFDLQNVQVLKGPQGTLFGRNTTGGAVLLVPQKPTDRLEGYLEGSAGNFNMKRIQGVLNVPINDTMRARFGVDRQTRDGTYNAVPGANGTGVLKDLNDVNYVSLRASLDWDLTPNLDNYTILTYTKVDDHPGGSQIFQCNPSPVTQIPPGQCAAQLASQTGFYDTAQNSTPHPYNRQEQSQIINTTAWRASDALTVKNILSYAKTRGHAANPVFLTAFVDSRGLPFAYSGVGEQPGIPTNAENTLVEELQFQGKALNNRLTWQGGLYYEHSKPDGQSGVRSLFDTACDPSTLHGPASDLRCADNFKIFGAFQAGGIEDATTTIEYENKAVYLQGTYDLTEKLSLTGGFRYTWDETKGAETSIIYGFADSATYGSNYGPPNPNFGAVSLFIGGTRCESPVDVFPTCSSRQRQKSSAPTWLADVDYKLTPDNLLYAKYSRGYRQGGVIPQGLGGFNTFGPEEVDAYEIGSKNAFRGALPSILNLAVFYNDFKKQQLQFGLFPLSGAGTTAIYSDNASKVWGVELEGNVELFQGFRLSAAYTYLHTKVEKLAFPDPTVCTGAEIGCFIFGASPNAAVGQPLSNSPSNKASITASYTLPTPEAIGAVTVSATYNVTSHYQTCAIEAGAPFCGVPGFETVNLNLDWKNIGGSNVDGAVFATNLLQKHYTTFVSGTFATGFEARAVGDPRMVGVRLRYRFGG